LALTVKDFAKTLKISDSALLERMQNAGLSHSKNTDEITAADKQGLIKIFKGSKDNFTKISNVWFGSYSNI
jgi:translation initiation factor IF-2